MRQDLPGSPCGKAKARGKLRGLGVSYYVEACAGGGGEQPRICRFEQAMAA